MLIFQLFASSVWSLQNGCGVDTLEIWDENTVFVEESKLGSDAKLGFVKSVFKPTGSMVKRIGRSNFLWSAFLVNMDNRKCIWESIGSFLSVTVYMSE